MLHSLSLRYAIAELQEWADIDIVSWSQAESRHFSGSAYDMDWRVVSISQHKMLLDQISLPLQLK